MEKRQLRHGTTLVKASVPLLRFLGPVLEERGRNTLLRGPEGLWRSDRSPEGTVLVKNIQRVGFPPGAVPLLGVSLNRPTVVGDAYVFLGTETFGEPNLWRADNDGVSLLMAANDVPDGTAPSSTSPKQIGSSTSASPGSVAHFDASHDPPWAVDWITRELWVGDSAAEGSALVKKFGPVLGIVATEQPFVFTRGGDYVYFQQGDAL